MAYIKDQLLPDVFKVFLNVVSSLLVVWGTTLLKKSSEGKGGSLFPFSVSPFFYTALYIVYFFLFVYFSWKIIKGISRVFFSYIDHLQEEYLAPNIDLSQLDDFSRYSDYHYIRDYESFNFRIKEASMSGAFEDIFPEVLLGISDPKCLDNDCVTDLVAKRSYFGFYKYTCPNCKKKYKTKYSQSTLKANLKKVIFAEHERKEDKLPF